MRLILSYSLLLVITACGFHLRGQSDTKLMAANKGISIYVPSGANSSFAKEIILALQLAQFTIVKEEKKSDYQLVVVKTGYKQNAIGIDELGRNNEFEISLSSEYMIIPNQRAMQDKDDIRQEFSFSEQVEGSVYLDADDIIGKRAELHLLQENLSKKIIQKILSQLNKVIQDHPKSENSMNEKQG